MNKVAILIPAHCPPKVLKLTLGSWLETFNQSYEVRVYIGLHSNYHHYHTGKPEIEALQGPGLKLCYVDEIDWGESMRSRDAWGHIMRYSRMHAVSLVALLKEAASFDPDYVAIFDHDLVFKQDFVRWAFESYPLSDLVGCLMNDRDVEREVYTGAGSLRFMPKFSVWHLVMNRRCFQHILKDLSCVFPKRDGNHAYDTFAQVYSNAISSWKLRVRVLREADIVPVVKHIWTMSMNLGVVSEGAKDYPKRVEAVESEYDQRFPSGIAHLLSKIQ